MEAGAAGGWSDNQRQLQSTGAAAADDVMVELCKINCR